MMRSTRRRWTSLTLGTLLLLVVATAAPGVTAGDGEQATFEGDDLDEFKAERIDELEARWMEPSSMDEGTARELLVDLHRGAWPGNGDGDADEADRLARYLRDVEGTAAADDLVVGWVVELVAAGETPLVPSGEMPTDDAWQNGTWDAYGAALTTAYGAAEQVHPTFGVHDVRSEGLFAAGSSAYGCEGTFSYGYCYQRIIRDYVAVATLDAHQTTDTVVLQSPVAVEHHRHWRCFYIWGSYDCFYWYHTHILDVQIADEPLFELAYPAVLGELATRATDHDATQMAYDATGHLHTQHERENTSAPPLGEGPAPNATGGTPGLGDLHAAAPVANFYGLQAPSGTVSGSVNDVHVRERAGPAVNVTGPTVGYAGDEVRSWESSALFVRWKNVGLGSQNLTDAPPASLYYDAAAHVSNASGNLWTLDYAIWDPPVADVPGL